MIDFVIRVLGIKALGAFYICKRRFRTWDAMDVQTAMMMNNHC
jgi:hypothetical protein